MGTAVRYRHRIGTLAPARRYRLHELDDRVQETLIIQWREREWECVESDWITETFRHDLAELGYPTEEIYWSLGYCQGDGVAFYGRIETAGLRQILERVLTPDDPLRLRMLLYDPDFDLSVELSVDIVQSGYGHYSHRNAMRLRADWDARDEEDGQFLEEAWEHLEPLILSDIQNTTHRLEKTGYDELEYLTGEERAYEALADCWYDEDGEEVAA